MNNPPHSSPTEYPPSRQSALRRYLTRHLDYKWLVLPTVGLGTLMTTLDIGMMSVSYPALTAAFSTDPSTVVWVGLAYYLTSIGLLFTMGWIADAAGRNRVFLGGLAVFTLGIGLSATATSIHQLVAYRILQGVGSAMTVATVNALLVAAFPPRQRGLALGLGSIFVGLGVVIGPFLGGLLLDVLDWRAVFYVRVPVGLLGLALGWALLDRERRRRQTQADYAGALLLFISLAALLLGINQAGRAGLSNPLVIAAFLVAVGLVPLIIRVERRAPQPVLALSLFRVPDYRDGMGSLVLLYQSWATVTLLIPFLMLNGMGLSALTTGAFLTSFSVLRVVLSPISGWLTDRVGPRPLMTAGVLMAAGGLVFLSRLDATTPQGILLLGLLVAGIGSALFEPSNSSAVMGSATSDRLGTAAASVATGRQVGLSVGYAVGTAIFASRSASYAGISASQVTPESLPVSALGAGIGDALLVSAVVTLLGVFFTAPRKRRGRSTTATPT